MTETGKPILCLDFDGVIHSYTSKWRGARDIPDPPVHGAMEFIATAQRYFTIAIYSSRTKDAKWEMQKYLAFHMRKWCELSHENAEEILSQIQWPLQKPAAFLTLDDRAMTFTGEWPDPYVLLKFKPWNKQ